MFDGSLTDLRIFENITHMAVRIDNPAYAPDLIDAALIACITDSKPVYIEMANTLVDFEVEPVSHRKPLTKLPVPQSKDSLGEAVATVLPLLVGAKNLVVLGGTEVARFNLQEKFIKLLTTLQAPYLSSTLGKGILSEYSAPYFSGTYNGKNSQQNVQDLINGADIVLSFGVQETDFNFAGMASTNFDPNDPPGLPTEVTINATKGAVRIPSGLTAERMGEDYWGDVRLEPFIDLLNEVISQPAGEAMSDLVDLFTHLEDVKKTLLSNKLPGAPFPAIKGAVWDIPRTTEYPDTDQITWDSFKSLLHHNYLNTYSEEDAPVVLADTGLTFYNLNNIKVPANGYIAQIAWGAIGYSPAASYGVKLALNDTGMSHRRVISISGDGAFSQSVNAIGTIGELGLDNIIFVMANGVYAIEQFLIDAEAFSPEGDTEFKALTRVPQTSLWNWKSLAEGFGGVGYEVTTNAELSDLLVTLRDGSPPPTEATVPRVDDSGSAGCCDFAGDLADRKSTFTLVAVRNVCKDLPSNTRWKLKK